MGDASNMPSQETSPLLRPNITLSSVMAGHSRSKNGVALLAYVPAIHVFLADTPRRRGWPE